MYMCTCSIAYPILLEPGTWDLIPGFNSEPGTVWHPAGTQATVLATLEEWSHFG